MASAARSTWRGAIEVLGFTVNVALFARTSEVKNLSFKYLIDDLPAKQVYISQADFEKREQAAKPKSLKLATRTQSECDQGVAVADGFKAIADDKITEIRDADRTRLVKPRKFVPLDTVPLELNESSYVVVPNDQVPGADVDVTQFWNGLLDSKLAYTSELTARAGSRDLILVVYARKDGLYAVALPFASEVKEVPEFVFARDAKQGKRLATFIRSEDELMGEAFDHSIYPSMSRKRREKAIGQALGKKKITVPKEPAKRQANDLMANLEQQVRAKKPGQRRTGRKIPAKA